MGKIILQGGYIQIGDDVPHFLLIELYLSRPTADDGDDLIHFLFVDQVVANIHHDVASADNRTAFSKAERFLRIRRKFVVGIDHILGVIHAFQFLARQTEPFGALCAGCDQDGIETQRAQIVKSEIALCADSHVAVVIEVGIIQRATELFPKAFLHDMFVRVNAVFSQSTGFDVAIE